MESAVFEFDGYIPFGTLFSPQETAAAVVARSPVRHETDRRFRALLDALPAAVYTTDTAGRITFYNEAAAELWGHRPQLGRSEWCGSWRLLFPDGKPMRHDECPMAIALREVRPVTGEAIAVRPDGTRVPFAAYPKPLLDPAGRLIGAVNTLVDISHRKAHEERQRLLINELNHRVKNTLATVQSIALQSLRGCPDGEVQWFQGRLIALSRAHDVLTDQDWQGAGMRQLLGRVIAPLVSPDDRRFAPRDRTCSCRRAWRCRSRWHCTNSARTRRSMVRCRAPGAGARGLVAERTQRRSRLRLRWEEAGGPAGAPPGRTGFGSRLITRRRARAECRGAPRLSRDRRRLRDRRAAGMTPEPPSKCRVLLVEDEALVAMLMEDMLAEFDCEVFATVGRLDEAMAVAGTEQFDMAFIDVNLRGVPAWPLADVLRSRGIPFAFVTGYGTAGTAATFADVPVLQKPFRAQELEATLRCLRSR